MVGILWKMHKYLITFVGFSSYINLSSKADAINDSITIPIKTTDDNFFVSDRRYLIKSFCMFLSLIRKVNLETYKFVSAGDLLSDSDFLHMFKHVEDY